MSLIDGEKFVHKSYPEEQARARGARIWRQKDWGQNLDHTAKTKKSKEAGKLAHFLWSCFV